MNKKSDILETICSPSSESSSKKSEMKSAIEELSMLLINVKPSHTHIPFRPFISVCKLVLQVLGLFNIIIIYRSSLCCYIYDINIYNSKIRLTVSIEESQTLQESMFEYAPSATGVKDYSDFVDEFLKGENK